MKSGLYLIHKPVGPSSASLVRDFQMKIKDAGLNLPVGHAGTLDPFASGLLIIMVGQATRLMELFHPLPKGYNATISWGSETDTSDHHGVIVRNSNFIPSCEQVQKGLDSFLGWTNQVPPATSAKKIKGVSAYKLAHRGEQVDLQPSVVYLHEAKLSDLNSLKYVSLTCKGGFYVRSFVRDLAQGLGSAAHLQELHRTFIGPWKCPSKGVEVHIEGPQLLPWYPHIDLKEDEFTALSFGQKIASRTYIEPEFFLPDGFSPVPLVIRGIFQNRLVALLRYEEGKLKAFANLRGGL